MQDFRKEISWLPFNIHINAIILICLVRKKFLFYLFFYFFLFLLITHKEVTVITPIHTAKHYTREEEYDDSIKLKVYTDSTGCQIIALQPGL